MSANGLVAGVDVGGTFTDIVLFDAASGALTVTKVPSTPANQSEGVIRGLESVLPGTWFTTSSEVVPEFREYERFSTTVINAYLLPVIDRYVKALGTRLDCAGYRGPVLTMSSAGGVMDLDTARTLPVRTILSGPAGGVAGATWIAGSVALEDFITCDMGGTSTDVCLIESGRPATSTESAFMGYPIKGRQIDINTVGAGGGSIAYVEGGSVLKVGPRSAGADPGPACYGKGGTEPTVTDANVVLGRVGHRPLGGAIRLDPERARVAVADLATRLGIADVATMAEGIVRLVVAEMANAIREISIERGYDPARFTLVPFGGAGTFPHVVGEAPAHGEQRGVLDALHRAPDEAGRGSRGVGWAWHAVGGSGDDS